MKHIKIFEEFIPYSVQPSMADAKNRRFETESNYNIHDLKDLTRLLNDIISKKIELFPSPNTWDATKQIHDNTCIPTENLLVSILYDKFGDRDGSPGDSDFIDQELTRRKVPYKQIDYKNLNSELFIKNFINKK